MYSAIFLEMPWYIDEICKLFLLERHRKVSPFNELPNAESTANNISQDGPVLSKADITQVTPISLPEINHKHCDVDDTLKKILMLIK